MRYILTESQYQQLQEIDWEGDFSDVNASCLRADYVVQMLNNEIDRIAVTKSLDKKSGKKRGKMDVYHPVYSKASRERLSSVDDSGELGIDVEKYIKAITTPPKTIFDMNSKMERSDMGGLQMVVNTGLPALVAIVYDIEKSEFYMINTCPSAGTCKNYCYARKGQYGMNDGKILRSLQRVNLLLNDPEEYYHMILDELEPYALKVKRQARRGDKDMQLVIRWNDSGDFFAQKYFEIAKRVTDELVESGYPVKSYAYTKMAKYYNLADDNFVMNFSTDAKKSEIGQLDLDNSKYSQVVQKLDIDENPIFMDLFAVGEDPKTGRKLKYDINPQTGLPNFVKGGANELKRRIAKQYNSDVNRLKFQHELPNKEGEKFQYDVIVLPTGDSDISAQRWDVQKTFLLIH